MRRISKRDDSPILTEGLMYNNDSANNKIIREMLLAEQGNICCYTEIHLSCAVKAEIDHFNPRLQNLGQDSYYNWFAISGQWNNEKLAKWDDLQPVLHPTAIDLEDRIIYDSGDFLVIDDADDEAKHLYQLLNLGDADLADQRKRYLKRVKEEIQISGKTAKEFFDNLMDKYPEGVYFIRALKEELGYVHPAY